MVCARVLCFWRAEEGVGFIRAGVTGGCVWPCVVQGTEPGSSGTAPRAHNFRGTSPVSLLLVTVVSLQRKAELKGPRMCSGSVLESIVHGRLPVCSAMQYTHVKHSTLTPGSQRAGPCRLSLLFPPGPSLQNGTSHNIREEPFLLS